VTIVPSAYSQSMAAGPHAAADAPEERSKRPSGRLLLRMPADLHAELARAAEREGTSLNGFITRALATRVGWGDENRSEEPDPDRRARTLLAVLIANAVVLALAAAAAVAILVLAWRA
jgi:hypothetical protein